jgi:hypothetical protein
MPVLARPLPAGSACPGHAGPDLRGPGGDLIQWTTHDAGGRRRRRAGDGESVRSAGRERDEIGVVPQADVAALGARSADPTRGHRSRSAGARARFVLRAGDQNAGDFGGAPEPISLDAALSAAISRSEVSRSTLL